MESLRNVATVQPSHQEHLDGWGFISVSVAISKQQFLLGTRATTNEPHFYWATQAISAALTDYGGLDFQNMTSSF